MGAIETLGTESEVRRGKELASQMDRDCSALQPVSISLASIDSTRCTTTNGLCPSLLSYLPSLPFSILPSYLTVLKAALSFHLTASPQSHFYHTLLFAFPSSAISLSNASGLSLLFYLVFLFTCFFHPSLLDDKKPDHFTFYSFFFLLSSVALN